MTRTIKTSLTFGILALALVFVTGSSGCAQGDESAWPETKEVVWDAAAQQCLHNGVEVSFADESAYNSCLSLAYAVIDGTYEYVAPAGDVEEKIIICAEYCEVNGNGTMVCTGVRCIEY